MKIRLLSLTDPDRIIVAIKALRDASKVLDGGSTPMGLREAKNAVDALRGLNAAPATVVIDLPRPYMLDGFIAYEKISAEADAARFALRAAIIGVSPATLDSLATVLPLGSPERDLLTDAAAHLRGAGA